MRVGVRGVRRNRAVRGEHIDRHFHRDQADVVARKTVHGVGIRGPWTLVGGSGQNRRRSAEIEVIEGGAAIEIESVVARTGKHAHAVRQREDGRLAEVRFIVRRAFGAGIGRGHRKHVAVHVVEKELGRVGGQVPDHDDIGFLQVDPWVVDAGDLAQIRHERRVRRDRVDEDEIDFHVRITVQTACIVDVEPVQDAIGKLVIARPVIRILETLHAHAHHYAVGMSRLPTAKDVEIVQVGCLIFEQQWTIAMAGGEGAGCH